MSKHKRRAGKTWLDEVINKFDANIWRKKKAGRHADPLRLVKA